MTKTIKKFLLAGSFVAMMLSAGQVLSLNGTYQLFQYHSIGYHPVMVEDACGFHDICSEGGNECHGTACIKVSGKGNI